MRKGQGLKPVQALFNFSELLSNPRGKPRINNTRACRCPRVKLIFSKDSNYRITHTHTRALNLDTRVIFPFHWCRKVKSDHRNQRRWNASSYYKESSWGCLEGSTQLRESRRTLFGNRIISQHRTQVTEHYKVRTGCACPCGFRVSGASAGIYWWPSILVCGLSAYLVWSLSFLSPKTNWDPVLQSSGGGSLGPQSRGALGFICKTTGFWISFHGTDISCC